MIETTITIRFDEAERRMIEVIKTYHGIKKTNPILSFLIKKEFNQLPKDEKGVIQPAEKNDVATSGEAAEPSTDD